MITQPLMFRPDLMSGERILITGGGTGLGRVMAEAFLSLGATVHICGRRGAIIEAAADEMVTQSGGTVVGHACDIRKPESIDAMIDAIWAEGGALTGLVNNAAGNFISRTEDLTVNGFNAISDIVFRGTFYTTHNVGKRLIAEEKRGNFLSILTTWIWNGGPFTVPSAMSKAGIHIMTQSLATEWGRYGLRFNAIAPGAFPTKGMTERLSPGNSSGREQSGNPMAKNPMGRVGEMHEFANLAVYLMARGSEYVNGQTIAIDGAGYQANAGNFYQSLARMDDDQWGQMAAMIRGANDKDKADRSA